MNQDFINFTNAWSKQAFDATRELVEIQSRTFSKLVNQQVALMNGYLDGAVKQAEVSRDDKDAKSYFSQQAEIVKNCNEQAVNRVREGLDTLAQAQEEIAQWAENNFSEATEKTRQAAAKTERTAKKAA